MPALRRLARIIALQTVTALLVREKEDAEEIMKYLAYIREEFAPDIDQKDPFSSHLVQDTIAHRKEIDAKIIEFAPEWPIDKLSPLERAMLEIGTMELMFDTDTPLPVIINEWVDIAKEFGDKTAGKFINGVLSNLGHAVRPDEKKRDSL